MNVRPDRSISVGRVQSALTDLPDTPVNVQAVIGVTERLDANRQRSRLDVLPILIAPTTLNVGPTQPAGAVRDSNLRAPSASTWMSVRGSLASADQVQHAPTFPEVTSVLAWLLLSEIPLKTLAKILAPRLIAVNTPNAELRASRRFAFATRDGRTIQRRFPPDV